MSKQISKIKQSVMRQNQINILMLIAQNCMTRNFIQVNLNYYMARFVFEVFSSVPIGSFLAVILPH